jgi:electron transfer flavoprotein alpha subunit
VGADSLEQAVDEVVGALLEYGLFGRWKEEAHAPLHAVETSPVSRSQAKDVWVVAECIGAVLRPVTLELLTKARQLADRVGSSVSAVAIGLGAARFAEELARYGADRVLIADEARFEHYDTEVFTAALCEAIRSERPGMVLMPSTAIGRDLAPRVAARLGLGLTGDCLDLELDAEGRLRQLKPAFGGSIVSPILSRTIPEMATVRAGVPPDRFSGASRRAQPSSLRQVKRCSRVCVCCSGSRRRCLRRS